MGKQTKTQTSRNRIIAIINNGKHLSMIEADELQWQSIYDGEGIGNGRKKKDVEIAFYLNANDDVIMKWEKPKNIEPSSIHRETSNGYIHPEAIEKAKELLRDISKEENLTFHVQDETVTEDNLHDIF